MYLSSHISFRLLCLHEETKHPWGPNEHTVKTWSDFDKILIRLWHCTDWCESLLVANQKVNQEVRSYATAHLCVQTAKVLTWLRGYKTFFMLNSAKHEICLANKSQITNNCKVFLAIHRWAWKFHYCWHFHIYKQRKFHAQLNKLSITFQQKDQCEIWWKLAKWFLKNHDIFIHVNSTVAGKYYKYKPDDGHLRFPIRTILTTADLQVTSILSI